MKPPVDHSNPYFRFLRRLKAGGRTNMYGAVPYLMSTFGLGREAAFRIVCEWLDQQAVPESASAKPSRRKSSHRPAA